MTLTRRSALGLATAGALCLRARTAAAAEIAVAQYGNTASAMPFAVALEKGYFRDARVDIDAIRSSAGGSADIRNMIAGGLPYAETALGAVMTAVKSGADIRIVSENVHTCANQVLLTLPDSPVRTLADLKGKRLTYTTPQSTSEVVGHMVVAKLGLAPGEVKFVATGPYGASLTALQVGGADVALIAEPVYSTANRAKFRELAWIRDLLPPVLSTVGVVPTQVAKEQPELIRGLLAARRRAVELMRTDPREASAIIGRVYKLDPALVEGLLIELAAHPSAGNVPYFGLGDFNPPGVDALVEGLKMINALDSNTPWRSLVDQSFLPEDLRKPL